MTPRNGSRAAGDRFQGDRRDLASPDGDHAAELPGHDRLDRSRSELGGQNPVGRGR